MYQLNQKEVEIVSGGAYLDQNGKVVIVPAAGSRPVDASGYITLGPNVPVIIGSAAQ